MSCDAVKIASAAAKIVEAQSALYRLALSADGYRITSSDELMRIHVMLGRALQDLAGEQ